MKTRIVLILSGMVATLSMAACSTRPPVDEIYLYYMNGSIDKKEFSACVEPNTKGNWAANNDIFALPTSLRTWNITPDDGGDTKTPITVGSKPDPNGQAGPQMHVWLTTEFYLNTNCDGGKDSPIVQFWEKTGRRYKVSDATGNFNEGVSSKDIAEGRGWKTVLLNTLVPVQNKAIQRVARDYTADELDTNIGDVWRKIEDATQAEFAEQLRLKVGGDYFCGVTYNRASKECPPVRVSITNIDYADPTVQIKRNEVRAAAEDAKKRLIEAQAKVDEAKLLSQAAQDPNYMRLKELEAYLQAAQACAANPNCTLIVGSGAGVNVNTK